MTDFKIKPKLKKKWQKIAGMNCCDGYSFGVVMATVTAFGVLDQGKTCKEAEKAACEMGGGITGFMAGEMASMVSQFHERGEEFRKYWNKKFGVDEKKAKGGTVNPAIFTSK